MNDIYLDKIGKRELYVLKKDEHIYIVAKDGLSEAVYGTDREAIAHIKGFRSGYHCKKEKK